jgi:hypothetical protein
MSDPVYYTGTIEAFNSAFVTFIDQEFNSKDKDRYCESLYDLETIIYDYDLEVYKNDLKKIIGSISNYKHYENNETVKNNIHTFLEKYFGIIEKNISFFDLFSFKNDKKILLSCFPFMYKGKCNSNSNDICYLYKPYSKKGYIESEITPKTKEIDIKSKINYIPLLLNGNNDNNDRMSVLRKNKFKIQELYNLYGNKKNFDLNFNSIKKLKDEDKVKENLEHNYLKKLRSMKSDYEYIKNYQTIKFIVKSEEIFERAIKDIMYLEKMISNILHPDRKLESIKKYAEENGWDSMSINDLNELLKTEEIKLAEKKKQQTELNKHRGEKTETEDDLDGKPITHTYHSYKDEEDEDKEDKEDEEEKKEKKGYYDYKTWNGKSEQIGFDKCKDHIDNLEDYIEYKTEDENRGGKSRRKKKRTKKFKKRTKKSKTSKRKRSRKCRK